jgi:hypothetical protein
MERTGQRGTESSNHVSRKAPRLRVGVLLLGGALALGGCIVVPARHAYAPPPGPVYATPAPVYVTPAPVYVPPRPYYWGGYGWRRHGRW